MASYQTSHIFSQGGDLSQLTDGFTQENDSGTNEAGERDLQENQTIEAQDETMSSRAEAMCEENRQINRFVELSLKQLEKKRIKLISKMTACDEESLKLLETQKRQSEQNLELQMNIEESSTTYANMLKERNKVEVKLEQIESFINKYEQNLTLGIGAGNSIEEIKQVFQSEFENIKLKFTVSWESMARNKINAIAELEEIAKKCKNFKNTMEEDIRTLLAEVQDLAFQNKDMLNRINSIQEEKEKSAQNKEALTESYCAIFTDHKNLNDNITQIYGKLNEEKTVNASRIQHLKLKINTDENIIHNLETKLKEKEDSMQSLTKKTKELTVFSNQIKEAVDVTEKQVQKKVKEIDLYKSKKPVLSDQARSLVENLKKYEHVESDKKGYTESISLLEEEIKLNMNNLSKKENILQDLCKKFEELENQLVNSREKKSELDSEWVKIRIIENKLISSVKEGKMSHQQERERKLEQNDTLKQTNADFTSKILECTLKYEELCSLNENCKEKVQKLISLIESYKETDRQNNEKLSKEEKEQIYILEEYNEKINEIKSDLDRNEFFLLEAKPKQEELNKELKKKELLEQDLKILNESHQKKINSLKNHHRAKIQDMDSEMEKHSSIMKNILTAEEELTNKLKMEIKEAEKPKNVLESELRELHHKLKALKNEEMMKRNKIVKMEKRQQAIMKEIKVTNEDIVQAVNEKAQVPLPPKRVRSMTPSSAGSYHSLYGKVGKVGELKENRPATLLGLSGTKQEITKKWIESVPVDDYEFSEV